MAYKIFQVTIGKCQHPGRIERCTVCYIAWRSSQGQGHARRPRNEHFAAAGWGWGWAADALNVLYHFTSTTVVVAVSSATSGASSDSARDNRIRGYIRSQWSRLVDDNRIKEYWILEPGFRTMESVFTVGIWKDTRRINLQTIIDCIA